MHGLSKETAVRGVKSCFDWALHGRDGAAVIDFDDCCLIAGEGRTVRVDLACNEDVFGSCKDVVLTVENINVCCTLLEDRL